MWTCVYATVDSGSAVSAIPKDCIIEPNSIAPCNDGPSSYTSASEHSYKVEGRVAPACWFQSGTTGKVAFKVLDPLKKVIVSVSQMTKAGWQIWLGDNSCMTHEKTGEVIKIYEKNGVSVMPIWIRGIKAPAGFQGQAAQTQSWQP